MGGPGICDGCGAGLRNGLENCRLIFLLGQRRHFCDLACLDLWSARRQHRDKLSREWWDRWQAEKGTRHDDIPGADPYWSYPAPPDDVSRKRDAELDAAALAAFPMSKPEPEQ